MICALLASARAVIAREVEGLEAVADALDEKFLDAGESHRRAQGRVII
jgi:hypothetical protein